MLKLKPDLTEADRIISQMTKYDNKNSHFIDMKKKISSASLDEMQCYIFTLHLVRHIMTGKI